MLSSRSKLNFLLLNTSVVVCFFPSSLICYTKRAVTLCFSKYGYVGMLGGIFICILT